MRIEALGLDHGLAEQGESAFLAMLRRVFLGGPAEPGGRREYPDLAVGKDSVHIK